MKPVVRRCYVEDDMPVVSRFLGIVIAMYWDDHVPAHFHAKYGEYEIIVHIAAGVVEGRFPKRALRHVMEWCELHKDELLDNLGEMPQEGGSESHRPIGMNRCFCT